MSCCCAAVRHTKVAAHPLQGLLGVPWQLECLNMNNCEVFRVAQLLGNK